MSSDLPSQGFNATDRALFSQGFNARDLAFFHPFSLKFADYVQTSTVINSNLNIDPIYIDGCCRVSYSWTHPIYLLKMTIYGLSIKDTGVLNTPYYNRDVYPQIGLAWEHSNVIPRINTKYVCICVYASRSVIFQSYYHQFLYK